MSLSDEQVIRARRFGLETAVLPTSHERNGKPLTAEEQLEHPEGALIKAPEGLSRTEMLLDASRHWMAKKNGGKYDRPGYLSRLPERKPLEGPTRHYYRVEVGLRLKKSVETRHPFLERLVMFWSNHLAISTRAGGTVRMFAGEYERSVIRPHILGSFSDMLLAAVRHPAFLIYFNAELSTGPNAKRHGKNGKGFNENIGRELLELHTLGNRDLYTLKDIQSLSLILTGWGHAYHKDDTPGEFKFRKGFHEPGPIELLGEVYRDEGVQQGEKALQDLARHPATALHLSKKLIRYFSGHAPSDAHAFRLAQVYLEHDTHLLPVMRELVRLSAEWDPSATAFLPPYDFLVGSLRAVGYPPGDLAWMMRFLKVCGQETWSPPAPDGWSDDPDAWLSPEGLNEKFKWIAELSDRVAGVHAPEALAEQLLGNGFDAEFREMLARTASREQAIALILMNPTLQRR